MPEIILNDIPINFPFEPYEVQKEYMRKVLECLQKGVNGVLESPTGTGKTLSLLCASLAWLEIKKAQIQATIRLSSNPGNSLMQSLNEASGITKAESQSWGSILGMPKIIYASRTHTQLAQAVCELKRTHYSHVKVAVLGSRDQLCLHPDVAKETNAGLKISMCRSKVSTRTCQFYNNVDKNKADASFAAIMDIEDLVQKGRKAVCCPYYLSREMHKNADIVFVPYNYLLDAKIRELQEIQISNNVIILDEAHNVEKVCEESSSFQLSSTDIAICITEVTRVMKDMHEQMQSKSFDDPSVAKDFTADDLCILKAMFTELEEAVDAIDLNSGKIDSDNQGSAFPGSYILDILSKAEITPDKLFVLMEILHNVSQYLSVTSETSFQHRGAGLQKFHDFIKVVAKSLGPERDRQTADKFYKLYVEPEGAKKGGRNDAWSAKVLNSKSNSPKMLNFWCFSAGFGMRSLLEQGVRSIVLTSGTLAPLDATIMELGIPVDVKLENPHIVDGNQVCVSVVKVGPTNTELKSTYENRDNVNYLKELAFTLQNFSRVVPQGLLVFFPSYSTMEKTVTYWQEQGLWSKINSSKPMFVEPRQKDALAEVMRQYYECVDGSEGEGGGRGAILLGVCRGKVSEGLDFANGRGRAVVVTGLPFPPYKDARVVLKRQYIDQNRNAVQTLTGQEWYRLEATRAVNQAVGRVIRHAKDYGAILLCDSRFGFAVNTKSLSKWLQPHLRQCNHFKFAYSSLFKFFRHIGGQKCLLPKSSTETVGASFMYSRGEIKDKCKEKQALEEDEYKKKLETKIEAKREMFRKICCESPTNKQPAKAEPKNLLAALDCAEEDNSAETACSSVKSPPQSSSKRPSDVTNDENDDVIDEGCASLQENLMKKRRVIVMNRSYKENELSAASNIASSSRISSPSLSSSSSSQSSLDWFLNISMESATAIIRNNELQAEPDRECLKKKVTAYWWMVKKTLKTDMFYVFKLSVMDYRSKMDLDKVFETLKQLFPIENPDMHVLFKGFFHILLPRHKEQFKTFCDNNKLS